MTRKPSLGRQKIRMEKIAVKNHLQVTFSKRRSGLFKKASELSTLCGIHVAVVVFSPAKKVFSFGHPDVDSLLQSFQASSDPGAGSGNEGAEATATRRIMEARREMKARELNEEFSEVVGMLEEERRKGAMMENVRRAGRESFWWEDSVEEMGILQLHQLRFHLEQLKKYAAGNGAFAVVVPPVDAGGGGGGGSGGGGSGGGGGGGDDDFLNGCNSGSFVSVGGFGWDEDGFF